ncbi:MAG: hypothetical protein KTR21_07170, partial [Rhodobacteraceae bacterium]|nr:hypothetical protein [Paracoccaceae bacterium]
QLAIYLAGADPFVDDRLGRLALSKAGLRQRDELVLSACREAGLALARALGDVAARIEPGAALNRLSDAQEAELLDWDAEKYRQALEAARSAGAS